MSQTQSLTKTKTKARKTVIVKPPKNVALTFQKEQVAPKKIIIPAQPLNVSQEHLDEVINVNERNAVPDQPKEIVVPELNKWILGKPVGSIRDNNTSYMVKMSPPEGTLKIDGTLVEKGKQLTQSFGLKKYGTREEAYKNAVAWRYAESERMKLTENKIRYIDKDTIEVKLTQDKCMKTDAQFIDLIESHTLSAKKNEKSGKYYAMYQIGKNPAVAFTQLAMGLTHVKYLNGDTLDVRSSNVKLAGNVDVTKRAVNPTATNTEIEDQVKFFPMINIIVGDNDFYGDINTKHLDSLPLNVWLLGKPAGTVFKRTGENIWTVNVKDEKGKTHSTTFNIAKYADEKDAFVEAMKWKIMTSFKLGMTKNMIRIVDKNTIEVKLTKNEIMKTDKIFTPFIQKNTTYLTTSGEGIKYVSCSYKKNNADSHMQYHTAITGFKITDHINGDTLNNCLTNLRSVSISMNNSNKHTDTDMSCIKQTHGMYGEYITVTVKMEKKPYNKHFSIKEHTLENAIALAQEWRDNFKNISSYENLKDLTDIQQIKVLMINVKRMKDKTKDDTIYDINKYLTGFILSDDEKKVLFDGYFSHQMSYFGKLNKIYDNLSKMLIETVHM